MDRSLSREQAMIDGIQRGRADVAAGNLIDNDAAFAELRAAIGFGRHKRRDFLKWKR